MKLQETEKCPPGMWAYTQPESGEIFRHFSMDALLSQVARHRKAMGYAMPADWVEKLQDDMCEQNKGKWPERWCGDPPPAPNGKRRATIRDIFRFLSTVESLSANGWKAVPQEEAERRASICAQCPHNTRISCLGCNGVAKLASNLLGKRGTAYDDRLQSCDICGCVLKLKVHIPMESVDNTGLEYPDFCWQSPKAPAEKNQVVSDGVDKDLGSSKNNRH